jgi:hypothetical protein
MKRLSFRHVDNKTPCLSAMLGAPDEPAQEELIHERSERNHGHLVVAERMLADLPLVPLKDPAAVGELPQRGEQEASTVRALC